MRSNKIILSLGFTSCLALLSACAGGELPVNGPPATGAEGERKAVAFSAQATDTRTSADGSQWLTTDQVGIYMMAGGDALSAALSANCKYQPQAAGGSALLVPAEAGQTIYYPSNGAVDFVAYYPWKESGTGAGQINAGIYPVDISDQSVLSDIYLLYAQKTDVGKGLTSIALSFRHQLSRLTLQLRKDEDMSATDLSAAVLTLSGTPATADFSLETGQMQAGAAAAFSIQPSATSAAAYDLTYEALIIPHAAADYPARSLTIALPGESDKVWLIPSDLTFEPGVRYTYALTLSVAGLTAD
ncbi:MAG: fimbrillin family protein [Tannerellaceae bacterium]|jgi:hypothetical protein|nr:fimbrillin family protein [Tannerellaceae bacterium]